jgi:rare lipoprotein A
MRKNSIYIIIALSIFITACVSSPRFTNASYKQNPPNDRLENNDFDSADILESSEGLASFYADKYNGRPTYSGVIYDMNGISAAHQKYQMGTIVRVTNLKNQKNIVLEINDRMPYWEDRILDLSLGAAKELDTINDGLVKVRIEVLKWGEGKK